MRLSCWYTLGLVKLFLKLIEFEIIVDFFSLNSLELNFIIEFENISNIMFMLLEMMLLKMKSIF